jgi:hypothetical protein
VCPSRPMEVIVESKDPRSRPHVDKGIANIAVVQEIYRKVQVVKTATVSLVDKGHKHLLSVPVWYVFDHERCPTIAVDEVRLDNELLHFSLRVVPALDPKLFDLWRYLKGIFLEPSYFLLAGEPPIVSHLLSPIFFRVDIGLCRIAGALLRLLMEYPIPVSLPEYLAVLCVNFDLFSLRQTSLPSVSSLFHQTDKW